MCSTQSLTPTNRSFSCPHKMNADTVWQWSMRLWFLIIAWKEAEGCRRGAQKGGYFTGNQQVPQSGFTSEPVGMTSCFFPWWLISSHHNTPSNPPLAYVHKTHACCYGDSGGSWQDGEDVFFCRDPEEVSRDVSSTHRERAAQGQADI